MALNLGIFFKSWAIALWRHPGQFLEQGKNYSCPCCNYQGRFATAKKRLPIPFRCPNCESRPRDRQIFLYLKERGLDLRGKKILHLAPEWPLFRMLRNEPDYIGGDIIKRRNANAIVDITNIQFPSDHFDFLICNHVLEHVQNDEKAMKECFRVMRSGAMAIFSVPLSGKDQTWEPPEGMPVAEVEEICGWDHKRFYGFDFSNKLEDVGFKVSHFECNESTRDKYCLRDDRIFIATK